MPAQTSQGKYLDECHAYTKSGIFEIGTLTSAHSRHLVE